MFVVYELPRKLRMLQDLKSYICCRYLIWHEYLDMIFLFKVINGYVHVSKDGNPVREIYSRTRSSNNPSLITLKTPFARTVCYQSSYFRRESRV